MCNRSANKFWFNREASATSKKVSAATPLLASDTMVKVFLILAAYLRNTVCGWPASLRGREEWVEESAEIIRDVIEVEATIRHLSMQRRELSNSFLPPYL